MLGRTRLKRRFFLDGLLWLFLLEFGIMVMSLEPGFLDFDNLPDTNFTCVGKVIGGYYADLETNCQMFHVCTIGQENEPMDIRFLCLNGTVFDQETRVCERIDEVDCSKSEQFYSLNLELYGNTQPAIQEESSEDSETERSQPKPTPTTTTTRPSTSKYNKRPPFYTTTGQPLGSTALPPQSGKGTLLAHHFSVSSTDIRFNPEEINISLNAGAPPDIRTKHHQPYAPQFSDNTNTNQRNNNMFSDNSDGSNNSPFVSDNNSNMNNNNSPLFSDNSNREVTAHSSQYSDVGRVQINHEDSTTQTTKSVFTIDHQDVSKIHSTNSDLKQLLNSAKFGNPSDVKFDFLNSDYSTDYSQDFRFNNPDNYKPSQSFLPQISEDAYRNKQATITYHPPQNPTTFRTIFLQSLKPPNLEDHSQYHQHQTEKPPQRVQIPIPVLPTLPPLTFSSPAPFTLTRHIDAKRYTKDHPSPPRIIISASASVTDDSGRRLNYSLGTIGAAHILDSPPSSYDEYKDSDVGLDPFYHDVPKLQHRRRKRSVEFDDKPIKTQFNPITANNGKESDVKAQKMDFKNLEMLKNPKDIEELLKFFGTIKDEEDLERLLSKRSADPQKTPQNGRINVFDIIRNEKEAVEVLKFLFTWYKSHQATATAPPITIPVSPEIISRINYEFAPQDSLSDSSELRYTTKRKESSTHPTPFLLTPKNIPVMYLDYLDGIKIETKDPKVDNTGLLNENISQKPKDNQSNLILNTNNLASPFSANQEPTFDVNDYVNDNYEPEVLKYWGKQSGEIANKPFKNENTNNYKNELPRENIFKNYQSTETSVSQNIGLTTETKYELKNHFKENISSSPLLPPKESINSLAKEVLVQNYYLSSTEENKSPVLEKEIFTEGYNKMLYYNSSPLPQNSSKPNISESNFDNLRKPQFNEGTLEPNQTGIITNVVTEPVDSNKLYKTTQSNDKEDEYFLTTTWSNKKESFITTSTTQKSTAKRRFRGRKRYPHTENKDNFSQKNKEFNSIRQEISQNETTTSTLNIDSTKINKKYQRTTTTRPTRGRFRGVNRKPTTTSERTIEDIKTLTNEEINSKAELTTLKSEINQTYNTNTPLIQNDYGLPFSNLEEHLFSSTTNKIKPHNQTSLNHDFKEGNYTSHLNLLALENIFKNHDDNVTFFTEHPLNIELQPQFDNVPYEIQKLKNNESYVIFNTQAEETTTQGKDTYENFKYITEIPQTTQETVVPIFYKKRNRIEFDHTLPTKSPIRNLEIVLVDDTTATLGEKWSKTNMNLEEETTTKPTLIEEQSATYPSLDDTTATTPIVSYLLEDILASTFPSITESTVHESMQNLVTSTSQKTKKNKTKRPSLRGHGKSRFTMNIEHHSIKKQLTINETKPEDNDTTIANSYIEEHKLELSTPSPKLLLKEYISVTSTETVTEDPLKINIPLIPILENTTEKEHTEKTKIEIVGTTIHIKNLLLKEKSDNEESTENFNQKQTSKKRGRKKFLDLYSPTTTENVDIETRSAEIPKILYDPLKTNTENEEYTQSSTVDYDILAETTLDYNKNYEKNISNKEDIKVDSDRVPTNLLEKKVTVDFESRSNYEKYLENLQFEKLTTVPEILKYLVSEIETTTKDFVVNKDYDKYVTTTTFHENVETSTLNSAAYSSTREPENFFIKISKMEEDSTETPKSILMDVTEGYITETSNPNAFLGEQNKKSISKLTEMEEPGPSYQQMKNLKNSSHLLQILVENSTLPVDTTLPLSSTSTIAPQYYTRRTRPPRKRINDDSREFGRHRFSTELFTRNPIDVTKNEVESNDKITDAPLHRSVLPTSEVRKTSTTPQWRRSYEGSLKRVSSNYIFNCFGKKLNTFYSDPRDCRLFHYCTQGYSKNQLLDLKYVCDLETYFDDEKLVCSKVRPQRCL